MPSLGSGSIDIRSLVSSLVNFAKSKTTFRSTSPCDGFILKLHYRWTMLVLLGGFFVVWYGWYHRDVISCVSHFNADTQVRMDYINVCLSYPYLELENGERRYLLFYRWIHYTLFLLAGVFYLPRKMTKNMENQKLKYLFEKIATGSAHYDMKTEADIVNMTLRYLFNNLHTHNGLYYKHILGNVVALLVDVFALHALDFVLQNRFMYYGYLSYPYVRDPKEFTDYISQTFPPFAACEIDEVHQLVAKRGEKFGCHLTMMEFYEKLFFFVWVWLWLLMIVTIIYLIFILAIWLTFVKNYILKSSKSSFLSQNGIHVQKTISDVVSQCRIGDVYLLYCLKPYLSHADFYLLLNGLNTHKLINLQQEVKMPPKDISVPDYGWHNNSNNPQSMRNRKPIANTGGPGATLENLLLNAGQQSMRVQDKDNQLRAPLIKKPNTAVYIQ